MMKSSNRNITHITGPLCGEFTGPGEFLTQRPVTRSFDVFFDLRLNKLLSEPHLGFEFLQIAIFRCCGLVGIANIAQLPRKNPAYSGLDTMIQYNGAMAIAL